MGQGKFYPNYGKDACFPPFDVLPDFGLLCNFVANSSGKDGDYGKDQPGLYQEHYSQEDHLHGDIACSGIYKLGKERKEEEGNFRIQDIHENPAPVKGKRIIFPYRGRRPQLITLF